MGYKICVVPGCHFGSTKGLVRFPRPEKLVCEEWVRRINNPKFEGKSLDEICANSCVCLKHFSDECRLWGSKKSYIMKYSLPSLHLPCSKSSGPLSNFLRPERPKSPVDYLSAIMKRFSGEKRQEVILIEDEPSISETDPLRDLCNALAIEMNNDVDNVPVTAPNSKEISNAVEAPNTKEETEVEFGDFERICRTCMTRGESFLTPIFQVYYDDQTVPQMLEACASIGIDQSDTLPHGICSNCLQELVKAYDFIRKCQNADSILRPIADVAKIMQNDNLEVRVENVKKDYTKRPSGKVRQQAVVLQNENVQVRAKKDYIKKPARKIKQPEAVSVAENIPNSDNSEVQQENVSVQNQKNTARPRIKKIRTCFTCKFCRITFDTFKDLKIHRIEANHANRRLLECELCDKRFRMRCKLQQHMRSHTKEKPYTCTVCSKAFGLSGNLSRHMMIHTGKRPHVCEICGKGFIQAPTLYEHRKTHLGCSKKKEVASSDQVNFVCHFCGISFKGYAGYKCHLRTNHSGGFVRQKVVGEREEYACDDCNRTYKTKQALYAHRMIHRERRFLCSECGKAFVSNAGLQIHSMLHTGVKPHTCTVCGNSFAQSGTLKVHMLRHTGEKPYHCNVCFKTFQQSSHLTYHMRTHSGERPYLCPYCGKSFALKGNLTVHIRTHTGETPYTCSVCGKGFHDSSSMKSHRKRHGNVSLTDLNPTNVENIMIHDHEYWC